MFKKKDDKAIDYSKLNSLISLSNSVAQVLFLVLIVGGIYVLIIAIRETQVLNFLFTILSLLTPLFIGIAIAWLFNPIVTKLNQKGVRRVFGTTICYLVFFIILALILNSLIPLLASQIQSFISVTLPDVYKSFEGLIATFFNEISAIEGFDVENFQEEIFAQIQSIGTSIVSGLPNMLVSFVTALFSGIGVFAIGLIIGFMLLIDFDKFSHNFFKIFPKSIRKSAREISGIIDNSLTSFIKGALIDSTVIFIISFIAFSLIGLESAVVFALFCAITNIIPYVGPYIGGAPAVIVGLTQSFGIGIAVLVVIAVLQFFEGNFLQPYIMSKTTKMSPIFIIIGLLVFGYFFGILGMILSTPIMSTIKELFTYFNNKYQFIDLED